MSPRAAHEAAGGAPVAWALVDLVALVAKARDDGVPVIHHHRGMGLGRDDRFVLPLVMDLSAVALYPRGAIAERSGRLDLLEADDAPEGLGRRPVLAAQLECHVLEHGWGRYRARVDSNW